MGAWEKDFPHRINILKSGHALGKQWFGVSVMLTTFLRSVVLYAAAVLALRLMGKRQVGQLQPYELAVVIMIAELAATPMGSLGIPLLYGIVPMLALLMCHGVIQWLSGHSARLDAVINGEPTVLVRHGKVCEQALRKQGLSMTDLLEAVRLGGELDLSQVGCAVMEPSGKITVFANAANRPVTPEDLQLRIGEEQLPLPLVVDGHVHRSNLRLAGMSESKLMELLARQYRCAPGEVLLFMQTSRGSYHLQRKGEEG